MGRRARVAFVVAAILVVGVVVQHVDAGHLGWQHRSPVELASYDYDGQQGTARAIALVTRSAANEQEFVAAATPARVVANAYDDRRQPARTSARPAEYRLAPRSAKWDGSQRIFRAVEPDELADLVGSGSIGTSRASAMGSTSSRRGNKQTPSRR